jgi:hypothetical protein
MDGKLVKLAAVLAVSMAVATAAVAQQKKPGGGQGGGQGGDHPQRPGGGGGGGGGGEGGEHKRPTPDELFDRADANQDGSLSRDEFKKWFENRPKPPRPPHEGGEGDGEHRPPPPRD